MSDLHCPATLLVTGVDRARELAESLRARRVARVYTSTMGRAVEAGEAAADVLGVDARAVDGLQARAGGETEQGVVDRYREALRGIADLHRGETVLVLTDGGVMIFVLPRIFTAVRDDRALGRSLPETGVAEVSVDADGFDVVSWDGRSDRAAL